MAKVFRDFICSIYIERNRMFSPLKSSKSYECSICNYNTGNIKDYNKHLMTRKHENRTKLNHIEQKIPKNPIIMYNCQCGKEYSARNSLWYHKKSCSIVLGKNNPCIITQVSTSVDKPDNNNNFEIDKELLIKMLLKNQDVMENVILKNQDVMEKMMEIMPKIGNNSHNTTNNTTNNQFNIQLFLNEHCKNAMNLTDFIDSLPITASTYDSTIENGLTKTITNMITNGLNKLDILERPIHCTDATRKTLYVKEADIWEKDTELLKVVEGIKTLIRKKRTLISRWKEANVGWDTVESKQMRFTELICNIMTDVDFDEKETGKIVRSISKSVYLDSEEKKKYLC